MSESVTLREVFQADQEEAAQRERVQAARQDADVVAAYYKRLKEQGVSPQHALHLTDSYQQMPEWDE